jgi:uncharacterized protein YegL
MADDEAPLAESWDLEEDWGEHLLDNAIEFSDNPEPRCPCVLVLDTSRSMAGEPIMALNRGLQVFREELNKNPVAGKRVDVALISFGVAVQVVQDFVTVDRFLPPLLEARGETPLGAAILKALDLVESRKSCYRTAGVGYFRPWIFLITDGAPQGEGLDVLRQAVQGVKAAEAAKKAAFFAVGVHGANMKLLARLSTRPTLKLQGLRFAELFTWLSVSTARAAQGEEADQLALPAVDWKRPLAPAAGTTLAKCWPTSLHPQDESHG